MQDSNNKNFWVHLLLFLLIVGMLAGMVFLYSQITIIKNQKAPELSTQNIYPTTTVVEKLVTPTPNTVSTSTPIPTSAALQYPIQTSAPQKVTSYVPFSGSFSTKNTDWTDVPGASAYVDLKNNYNVSAYVTFEASLHTSSGGTVFARLFDSTHGIAVDGSEISTSSTVSTLVSSGKLNLWSGNNLYKVQIKSLNSFNVTFDSARMKLVY